MEHLLHLIKYDPNTDFVFTHYLFWVFFGVVLLGNAILYKKSILRNLFLFAASLFFYYKAGGHYFILLLFSTLVDYTIGLGIGQTKKHPFKKSLLILSIATNLFVLGYFKYTYFLTDILQQIKGTQQPINNFFHVFINSFFSTNLDTGKIILPVGISFFTFQTISYSVDVYRNRIAPVKSIIDFGFYVSFFPQLVAGPIVRAWEFIPQLHKKYALSSKWFWCAIWLITGGLAKKMIISDYLSINFIDRVFDAPMMYSGVELLFGAYAYALQIYCDFSGYTDIAIGIALILGFRLPENFNRPYLSTSVTSFWKRWHISLSSWLRDYIYIPLGGNRHGKSRQGLNLMITMLIGGLWHGAGWLFILWGGLHGLALMFEKLFVTYLKKYKMAIPKFLGFLLTFHFVVFTWIIFRSPDLETLNLYLMRIRNAFFVYKHQELFMSYINVLAILLMGYMIHWIPIELKKTIKYTLIKTHLVIKLLLVITFCIIIYQFSLVDVKPFIYFRF